MSNAYDFENGTIAANLGFAYKDRGGCYRKEFTVDFSQQPAAGVAWGAGDTAKLLFIPAGTIILSVATYLITAEGAALTIGIGDSAGATTFLSTNNLNTTLGTHVISPVSQAGSLMKAYTADDYLLMTLNNAAAHAKVNIVTIMFDVSIP